MLFDAHNHLHRLPDPRAAISAMQDVGIAGCVVNATAEHDWHAVARLAADFPRFVQPAFGLHPWHAHEVAPGWQQRLEEVLLDHPHAAVGECGLDRAVPASALDQQAAVFASQVSLACALQRPLVIHCVRAWSLLFECFARATPPPRFLLHSFDGSAETARRLIPLGARFSFSGRFLHPHRRRAFATFATLPADRLLVESDSPDGPPPAELLTHTLPAGAHHPANLPVIAAALAGVRNLDLAELMPVLTDNHRACFGVSDG
jgi:TatD DNase family protein